MKPCFASFSGSLFYFFFAFAPIFASEIEHRYQKRIYNRKNRFPMLFESDQYAIILCIDIITTMLTHSMKLSINDFQSDSYSSDETCNDIDYQLTSLHSILTLFKLFNLWKRFPNVRDLLDEFIANQIYLNRNLL